MVMWRKTASDVNDAKVPNITVTMKMNWRAEKKIEKKQFKKLYLVFVWMVNAQCWMWLNGSKPFITIFDCCTWARVNDEKTSRVSFIVFIYVCVCLVRCNNVHHSKICFSILGKKLFSSTNYQRNCCNEHRRDVFAHPKCIYEFEAIWHSVFCVFASVRLQSAHIIYLIQYSKRFFWTFWLFFHSHKRKREKKNNEENKDSLYWIVFNLFCFSFEI